MEVIARPPHSHFEKRKILQRSTGSFSVIEENIIVPTPRKVLPCSPKLGRSRRDNRHEESLFGEAGFEIQNILFQPQIQAKYLPISQVLSEDVVVHPSAISISLNHDVHSAPLRHVTVLRASNPITLNSPFHVNEEVQRPSCAIQEAAATQTSNPRLYPANGRHVRGSGHTRKELNRGRSLSWPGIPKNYKKAEKAN